MVCYKCNLIVDPPLYATVIILTFTHLWYAFIKGSTLWFGCVIDICSSESYRLWIFSLLEFYSRFTAPFKKKKKKNLELWTTIPLSLSPAKYKIIQIWYPKQISTFIPFILSCSHSWSFILSLYFLFFPPSYLHFIFFRFLSFLWLPVSLAPFIPALLLPYFSFLLTNHSTIFQQLEARMSNLVLPSIILKTETNTRGTINDVTLAGIHNILVIFSNLKLILSLSCCKSLTFCRTTQQDLRIFIFTTAFRLTLGPAQPPIQ